MKNLNNILKLKRGQRVLIVRLKEDITVAIPTVSKLSNARLLDVFEDGSFTAHWTDNYNLDGDFRTELMSFSSDLVFSTKDLTRRNKIREMNDLVKIK